MKLQILVTDSGRYAVQRLDLFSAMLADSGFTVGMHTADLNEAVSLVRESRCDILVCFNRAPDFLAARLLRLTDDLPVRMPAIVISEYDDSQRMRECFLLGAIDFLSEPVVPEDLLRALNRAAEMIHTRLIDSEYRTALADALSILPQSPQNTPILAKLEDFLLKMKDQAATVELAADYFGFNRDYFGRWFKAKLGMTFGEFYKELQIRYARLLLESGQFRVQDVSRLLGFSSPDYFTRVFKRRTGQLPSDYRRL